MLLLQIKQAETALADGRLDEVYELLRSPALRSHRRGQWLISRLVSRLIERGRLHLNLGKSTEALADCERAQQLGGNQPQVVALRNEIEQAILSADRQRREQLRAGAVQSAAALVDSALERDDLDRAVSELVRARGNGCCDHRLRELDGNVRGTLRREIQTAIDQGRLDRVDPLLDRLARLDPQGAATMQLDRAMRQFRQAWAAIENGNLSSAGEILARLSVQLPQADWVKESMRQVFAARQALASVRMGALGCLSMTKADYDHDSPLPHPRRRLEPKGPPPLPSSPLPLPSDPAATLPDKMIVQVDGAGSFLVVRKASVTLGPISSSRLPDIALIAEAHADVVQIDRVEDDYFVNGKSGGKLLANGDRVSVSPRCRLVFGLPNPSSTSATLDLVAGRFPRADIRRVILLDRDLIIGPGPGSHIRVDQASRSTVLHIRDGRLWHRSQAIEIGKPLIVDGVSMVVTMG